MINIKTIKKELEKRNDRSAWNKGVTGYALELLDGLECETYESKDELKKALLNGADSWTAYSWGGCSEIYNEDIAARLCTPSELKKTKNGERRPNAGEEWLDVQTRALFQACNRIMKATKN